MAWASSYAIVASGREPPGRGEAVKLDGNLANSSGASRTPFTPVFPTKSPLSIRSTVGCTSEAPVSVTGCYGDAALYTKIFEADEQVLSNSN